jgi:peptide/nickel transport system substrate-binding protein
LPQPLDLDKAKFHLQKAGLAGSTADRGLPAANGSIDMAALMQQSAEKMA